MALDFIDPRQHELVASRHEKVVASGLETVQAVQLEKWLDSLAIS